MDEHGQVFFCLPAFYGVFAGHFSGKQIILMSELGVTISDFFWSPALIIGGILLIKKKALAYIAAAGLFFKVSMLFIALLAYFIITPIITDTPFRVTDFIIILIMTILFNIPFLLFLRGILKKH